MPHVLNEVLHLTYVTITKTVMRFTKMVKSARPHARRLRVPRWVADRAACGKRMNAITF
jgi:hypothetical protein